MILVDMTLTQPVDRQRLTTPVILAKLMSQEHLVALFRPPPVCDSPVTVSSHSHFNLVHNEELTAFSTYPRPVPKSRPRKCCNVPVSRSAGHFKVRSIEILNRWHRWLIAICLAFAPGCCLAH